ncbi:MAG: DUF4007 family protein [Colwellia sp.]|nr:DUF4007 family protein [Colwellia sp.]
MKAKFTGHDTFPLRYGWLYKAVNHLNSGGKLQTSKEEETQQAIIKLGVGKNMVNAIRYWADSAGLLESNKEQNFTIYSSSENGNYLFNDETGKDPYLEHIGSIWLIHFWLCFNQNEMTAYRYFFNIFNGEYFEKQILLAHMSTDIKKFTSGDISLNESTIQKDIDTFLNTYSKKLKLNSKTRDEEQFNSPMSELNLIQDNGKNYYLSDLNEKEELPIEVFIYALLKFVQKESKISKVAKVNFKSLLLDAYSPGRIFRLSEQGLGAKLDAAQVYSNNKILWLDSLGLRQITIDDSYLDAELSVLNKYYEECENG